MNCAQLIIKINQQNINNLRTMNNDIFHSHRDGWEIAVQVLMNNF